MRKFLLMLILGMAALPCFGGEYDENLLREKIEWNHAQGMLFYKKAIDEKEHPKKMKVLMKTALQFFELEREYISDMQWRQFVKDLFESLNDSDEDEDGPDLSGLKALLLK